MDSEESDSPVGEVPPNAARPASQSRLQSVITSAIRPIRNALGYPEMEAPAEPKKIDPAKGTFRAFRKLAQGQELDDRDPNHVFFAGMKTMSTLPDNSSMRPKFKDIFIKLVNNNQRLSGTPRSLDSNERQLSHSCPYVQRVANHSNASQLPDTSQVFDRLLSAPEPTAHINAVSGMVVAFATLVSLCLYRTDPEGGQCNETSPYLDLSPLYGNSREDQSYVRSMDGRGMLSPDCFFEDRLLFLTPAVQALLILWNRNHNYIASRLLSNNQGKRWEEPSSVAPLEDGSLSQQLVDQDDQIFDKARTINCVIFKNVVIEDFIKGIVGLPNIGNKLNLDLLADIAGKTSKENVSEHKSYVEFSLLHHWSSLASQDNISWMQNVLERTFGTKNLDEITPDDYKTVLDNYKHETDTNRRRREVPGLRRGHDGLFDDGDLAKILQDATYKVAGAPRARGVPRCMQIFELMAMQQARDWKVCSFNQFRKSLGLKALNSFNEWNQAHEVAVAAQSLYRNIENLELYVGLQAEDSSPGDGFGLGYTMTFGLLVDLVGSLRGDPSLSQYTRDYMTDWGYDQCFVNSDIGAFGAVLPKVLLRNLPYDYPYDNTYTLFPFTAQDPQCHPPNASHLTDLYHARRPSYTKVLQTQKAISQVLNDPNHYVTCYSRNLQTILGGYGFLLGFDTGKIHDADLRMDLHALLPDRATLLRYVEYFSKTADKLIHKSCDSGNRSIDVVEDVIAATCAQWICDTMYGNPAPNEENPHQVFKMLHGLYTFVFDLNDPDQAWDARLRAINDSKKLIQHIEKELKETLSRSEESTKERISRVLAEARGQFEVGQLSPFPFLTRLAMKHIDTLRKFADWDEIRSVSDLRHVEVFRDRFWSETQRPRHVAEQIMRAHKLKKLEKDFERTRITANVLGLCIMSVQLVQVCAHAIEFYLNDARSKAREEIAELSRKNNATDNPKIMGYIRESQRLGQPPGLFRIVRGVGSDGRPITQGAGQPDLMVYDGDLLFANFAMAFMRPDEPNVEPSRQTLAIQGLGFHVCPGIKLVEEVLPELLKSVFRMENLRISDGQLTAGGSTSRSDTGSRIQRRRAAHAPLSLRVNVSTYFDPPRL
ncbi:heme peroxidase [Neolentinus lepideus HHB14362 ss-1]|uniref:Heme peroxidase n=1 Tax=Neolentinus lepideus HHB14362 ss-1 TaxID=1314782 RepID=A0A165QFU0_9AGAM|nr:heme peroxidase [Neolentinus lepideus HHB14362 ss-1]